MPSYLVQSGARGECKLESLLQEVPQLVGLVYQHSFLPQEERWTACRPDAVFNQKGKRDTGGYTWRGGNCLSERQENRERKKERFWK